MSKTIETKIDEDNNKVLEKFSFLIDKYHHYQGAITAPESIDDIDKIPVLTECVTLRSKNSSVHFNELSPLRLMLDAALIDANIELNPVDRQALVHALENRIVVQEKTVLLDHAG